mgnify:CR=1 FL=1
MALSPSTTRAAHRSRKARFLLLVYRMPAKPTAGRVAVWRSLKKAGAAYVQDSVCVLPDTKRLRAELAPTLERIDAAGGTFHLLPLRTLPEAEEQKLVDLFRAQAAKHYEEIVENCDVNFAKEIEFETFRQNFTYEEAEEIRMEFEKIGTWFDRVIDRDWFGASNRDDARHAIDRCEALLESFEARVFALHTSEAARDESGLTLVRKASA